MARPFKKIRKHDILNEIHENELIDELIIDRLIDFCDGCFDCNCELCSFDNAINEVLFEYFNNKK